MYVYIYTYMYMSMYIYCVFTVCLNPHFAWVDHLFLWAI